MVPHSPAPKWHETYGYGPPSVPPHRNLVWIAARLVVALGLMLGGSFARMLSGGHVSPFAQHAVAHLEHAGTHHRL